MPFEKLNGQESLIAVKNYIKDPVSFFSVSEVEQRKFCKDLENSGIFYIQSFYSWKDSCIPDPCSISRKNGGIDAAIFVQKDEVADLNLAYVWCVSGHQTSLFSLMAQADESVAQRGDGFLYITVVEPQLEKIVEKMFPEREIVKYFLGDIEKWTINRSNS